MPDIGIIRCQIDGSIRRIFKDDLGEDDPYLELRDGQTDYCLLHEEAVCEAMTGAGAFDEIDGDGSPADTVLDHVHTCAVTHARERRRDEAADGRLSLMARVSHFEGAHVTVQVFVGEPGATRALAGHIRLRNEEWERWSATFGHDWLWERGEDLG